MISLTFVSGNLSQIKSINPRSMSSLKLPKQDINAIYALKYDEKTILVSLCLYSAAVHTDFSILYSKDIEI